MNREEYKDELLSFAKRQREDRPIPDAKELTEENWQRRIIGGSLMTWLDQRLSGILAERRTLRVLDFDQEPVVVFTTTPPGVAAARDIVGEAREDFVYLLREETEHWKENHRDNGFTSHIHYWSYFDNPSPELQEARRADHARGQRPSSQDPTFPPVGAGRGGRGGDYHPAGPARSATCSLQTKG